MCRRSRPPATATSWQMGSLTLTAKALQRCVPIVVTSPLSANLAPLSSDGVGKTSTHRSPPPVFPLQVQGEHDPRISAAKVFAFARDMLASSRTVFMPHDFTPVVVRIGIHTGPCVRLESVDN